MTGLLTALLAAAGGGTVVAVAVLLNPEKVALWATWIWRGLRLVSKRAEYRLIASDVGSQLNAHVFSDLREQLDGFSLPSIVLKWDNDSAAVAREASGTLIIRMRPHEDRALNLYAAALAATAQLVLPTLRSELTAEQSEGIDLQLCRRLAERLHQSAMVRYRLDVVDPAVARLPSLPEMLERLHALDVAGLFAPVLLQELTKLAAASLVSRHDALADEVDRFIGFLVAIAEREPGEDVALTFAEKHIRVNLMLVARHHTRAIGVAPYRSRVTAELRKEVNTIYVVASGDNLAFADEVARALDADRRLTRQRAKHLEILRAGRTVKAVLIPFERNGGYASSDFFRDTIAATGISRGTRVHGTVVDVQDLYASVDVNGLHGVVDVKEIGWGWCVDCRSEVKAGEEIECEVLSIDAGGLEMRLSRRSCVPNPTEGLSLAEVEDKPFSFQVSGFVDEREGRPPFAVGVIDGDRPAKLPADEYDWGTSGFDGDVVTPGASIAVVGLRILKDRGLVVVSRKRRSATKWDDVREKYPKDRRLEVTVVAVEQRGAFCEIEPGVTGFVSAEEFRRAGLEYADFLNNLRVGQRLFVAVSRVVAGERNRVNLVLQRNLK